MSLQLPDTSHLQLISRPRARQVLGMSVQTMEKWTRLGVLPPSVKIGNRHYWRLRDLERWIAEKAAEGAQAAEAAKASPSESAAA